jgi:hypothetical protein
MDADDAVVDFAATAQPLPTDPDGIGTALGRSRFINAADGFGMGMLAGDESLALVAHTGFVPLDRFQETL